jgi:hypothetical protein
VAFWQLQPPTEEGGCWRAGFEPRRLFNVVQFLMNDKEGKGTVSLEETMQVCM